MKHNELFQFSSKLIGYINSTEGIEYQEYLRDWFSDDWRRLAKEKDPAEIYRLQGEIKVLGTLVNLDHDMREYQTKVRTGVLTPKEKGAANGSPKLV